MPLVYCDWCSPAQLNGAASLRTVRVSAPSPTEMLFGESTKHSAPFSNDPLAVFWGVHFVRSSEVPLNSSSKLHVQVPPPGLGQGGAVCARRRRGGRRRCDRGGRGRRRRGGRARGRRGARCGGARGRGRAQAVEASPPPGGGRGGGARLHLGDRTSPQEGGQPVALRRRGDHEGDERQGRRQADDRAGPASSRDLVRTCVRPLRTSARLRLVPCRARARGAGGEATDASGAKGSPTSKARQSDEDATGGYDVPTPDGRRGLLDAQAADGPGDDELLDLLGAFEDVA